MHLVFCYPDATREVLSAIQKPKLFIRMVPVERIELPTFGLQNRCSTAELNRHRGGDNERGGLPSRSMFGPRHWRAPNDRPQVRVDWLEFVGLGLYVVWVGSAAGAPPCG